ncbi:hypothetical protein VTN02DRAFT_1429 [Thermoascus thermophilus]
MGQSRVEGEDQDQLRSITGQDSDLRSCLQPARLFFFFSSPSTSQPSSSSSSSASSSAAQGIILVFFSFCCHPPVCSARRRRAAGFSGMPSSCAGRLAFSPFPRSPAEDLALRAYNADLTDAALRLGGSAELWQYFPVHRVTACIGAVLFPLGGSPSNADHARSQSHVAEKSL